MNPLDRLSAASSLSSWSSGPSSLSGEPVVEGRACWSSAASAGPRAGGGHAGGAEQTPAVHVVYTQIRPGGAAAGQFGFIGLTGRVCSSFP